MMHYFLHDKIIIRKWRSKSNRRQAIEATATVDGSLQQLDDTKRQLVPQTGSVDRILYLPEISVSIKEGDQIKIKDTGDIYTIRFLEKIVHGIHTHYECVVGREEQQ